MRSSQAFATYLLITGCAIGCETTDEAIEEVSVEESELHGSSVPIGAEVSVPRHLQDGQEFQISRRKLIAHGQLLFAAVWTPQEGGGRPFTKGTGNPLSDPTSPLVFPRNFNRLSAPEIGTFDSALPQRGFSTGTVLALAGSRHLATSPAAKI